MEKQAVVREGSTPSEVSGNKSTLVKNGKALAAEEIDDITPAEERLAARMAVAYNDDRQP